MHFQAPDPTLYPAACKRHKC